MGLKFLERRRGPSGEKTFRPTNSSVKNELVAMIGEFVGTVMFLFLAFCGTNATGTFPVNTTAGGLPSNGGTTILYIALTFGFSLLVNAWIFFRISGSLFNPAVSLAMFLVGQITAVRAILATVAQLIGGIVAAAMTSAILPGTMNVTTNLEDGMSTARGLFLEMFLTAELVLTILMLAAEKHKGTFLAPVGIGLSLFVLMLVGTPYTGCSVNPARSFGPSVVEHSFPVYNWIYWLGPALGAFLAAGFYKFVKFARYEEANPGQQAASDDADTIRGDSQQSGDNV